jgi:Uma2 family endonuclease
LGGGAVAPDLCTEVRSPSNTYGVLQERLALFLAAGAREAWIGHPTGRVDCFAADGPLTASRIVPDWAQSIPAIAGVVSGLSR